MTRRKVRSHSSGTAGRKPRPVGTAIAAREDAADPLGRDERHQQFGALLEFSPDAIVIVDADGLMREWNAAAESMLLTSEAPAVQAPLRDFLRTPHREAFDSAWQQLIAGHLVPRMTTESGSDPESEPPLDLTVAPIRVSEILVGAVVILRALTRQRQAESATGTDTEDYPDAQSKPAPHAPHLDGPTGLPGAGWIQGRLSEPIDAGMARGIAVFDIDAFAMMTATNGPNTADAVLVKFGELLRSLDIPGAFAHRRADSFVWIVDAADPVASLNRCVSELTEALEHPFQVGEDRGWLTLSIGLATTTLVAGGELLAAANDALQTAKAMGGSTALYYDQSMESSATSSFTLASGLHDAIENEELLLHYQPIMDFATNEIVGVEALVRWERPGVGLLAPAAFIDAAERTGQIVPLGNWVVRTACHNALRLGSHSGGPRTMSINVSASQLRDPSLITTLREAMIEGQCAPSTIVIEVTETVLLHDLTAIAASLAAIKALDVGLDLDDFGTGYSSLQYLRNLPIDRLKVDQSFVAGLGVNAADTAIVASTIALAHALGLRTIAEGVETSKQLTLLREMGCDFAQGYLLSRPADMESFTAWLDAYVPAEVRPAEGSPATTASLKVGGSHDRRDKNANSRDAEANSRDLTAATRDAEANARDATAATRDAEANARDAAADEREKVADLRDAVADEREHAEDERERDGVGSGTDTDGGVTKSVRRNAEQGRDRAKAARKVVARDRKGASTGRDETSSEHEDDATCPTKR